jgi:hypothetical protein
MEQKKAEIEAKRAQARTLETTIEGHRSKIEQLKADLHSIEQQYSSSGASMMCTFGMRV